MHTHDYIPSDDSALLAFVENLDSYVGALRLQGKLIPTQGRDRK